MVVVTYRSRPLVNDFIASLDAGMAGVGRWRLVVVDNASDDGTVDDQVAAPAATVVGLGANRGYAAGVDAGVSAAGNVDAVLVANPDIRLRPEPAFGWCSR